MQAIVKNRLCLAWLALSAITVASWWIGSRHGHTAFEIDAGVTCGVILMAALKVRVIVWEFMEVRHAPAWLRRLMNAWLLVLVIALLACYSLSRPGAH